MTFCDSLDLKLNCKNALFFFFFFGGEEVHDSVLLSLMVSGNVVKMTMYLTF